MNSARCRAAIAAAALVLTACGQRAHSDATGAVHPTPSSTAHATNQSWAEQDRFVQAHLHGYGWVDRVGGAVHIPIERAMDLIVAKKQSSGPPIDPLPLLEHSKTNSAAQNKGRELFMQYGCSVCHDPNAPIHAPSLLGIYGQRVRLNDGTFVVADEHYLRDSILHSKQQVVAGYVPMMPDYSHYIGDNDVRRLIAYLTSLSLEKVP